MKLIKSISLVVLFFITAQQVNASLYSPQELDSLYSEALNGNISAASTLGNHYWHSPDNNTNRNLAFRFLSMAYDGGKTYLCPILGLLYYKGIGTKPDYKKAFSYFQTSLKDSMEIIMCRYYIGECYEFGYGVKCDKLKAIEYYNQCINGINSKWHLSDDYDYKSLSEVRLSELDSGNEFNHAMNAFKYNQSNLKAIKRLIFIPDSIWEKEATLSKGYGFLSPVEYRKLGYSDCLSDIDEIKNKQYIYNLDKFCYSDEDASDVLLYNALLYDKLNLQYDIDDNFRIKMHDENNRYNYILTNLLNSATLGKNEAYYHIGRIYMNHLGDAEKGTAAFVTAMQNGSKDGAYEYSRSLLLGRGIEKDEGKGLSLLSQLADEGHSKSIYELATFSIRNREEFDVIESLLLEAGRKGSSDSYCLLAKLYKNQKYVWHETWKDASKGVTLKNEGGRSPISGKNIQERNKLFIKYMGLAAGMDNPEALYELSLITNDEQKKQQYLEKSAMLGNIKAINSMAYLHSKQGNNNLALELWKKTASAGSGLGFYNIGILLYNGEIKNYDTRQAIEFFTESSNLNYSGANLMLAKCYANGYGVDKNINEAASYYRKYANDNWDGLYTLGNFYYDLKDYKKAFNCYIEAIEDPTLTETDPANAAVLREMATDNGYNNKVYVPTPINKKILGEVYNRLAVCYRFERGVEKDEDKAEEFAKKALALGNPTAQSIEEYFSSIK